MQQRRAKGRPEEVESNDAGVRAEPPRQPMRRLIVFATVLSAAALVAAVVLPGLGPRSVMVHTSRGGPWTIGAACTTYPGAELTIRAPGAGTIVVSATVGVGINHTFGTGDIARVVVATTETDCAITNSTAFVSVPRLLPTDNVYYDTVPILRAVPVSGAGAFTFHVNAAMDSGADAADRFDSASIVAVFYPS